MHLCKLINLRALVKILNMKSNIMYLRYQVSDSRKLFKLIYMDQCFYYLCQGYSHQLCVNNVLLKYENPNFIVHLKTYQLILRNYSFLIFQ